jgi:hypothetical protein
VECFKYFGTTLTGQNSNHEKLTADWQNSNHEKLTAD